MIDDRYEVTKEGKVYKVSTGRELRLPAVIAWVMIPSRVSIADLTFAHEVGFVFDTLPDVGLGSAVIVRSL